jgi:hypothetical protein
VKILAMSKRINSATLHEMNRLKGKTTRRRLRKTAAKRVNATNGLVAGYQLGVRNPSTFTQYPPTVTDDFRYEQVIETDGAGSFSAFVSLRNPLTALNGSGTYSRAPSFANLYDEYHVVSLSLIIDFLQLSPINGFTRIAVDYDSIPSGTYTPGDLRDNEYMREFSGTNQIAYEANVKNLSEGTYRDRPAVIHQSGWYDFNTPPDEGFIAIAGERFTPGGRIANITLNMRVRMRRRRTINNARDERLREEIQLEQLTRKLLKTNISNVGTPNVATMH